MNLSIGWMETNTGKGLSATSFPFTVIANQFMMSSNSGDIIIEYDTHYLLHQLDIWLWIHLLVISNDILNAFSVIRQ